jgi:uncharacterized membrane protein
MVQLELFENSIKNQALRTLIALSIIIPCDIVYLLVTERNFNRFFGNKLAYFNVWITLAVVFGVSLLSTNSYKINEVNNDTISNYVQYGLLIGLLVFVPLYNWILSCGAITNFTSLQSLGNTAWGVILSAFTCLVVFLISEKTNLIVEPK